MRKPSLPEWASVKAKGKIEVLADKFYPEYLSELDVEEPDQYWLEVAYQCMKMDIQNAVIGTDAMPDMGGALVISVRDATKVDGASKWAQSAYPKGKGAEAATKGKEARDHYARIRGGF